MKNQVASKFIKDDESAQQVSFEFQTIAFRFIFRTFKAQYDIVLWRKIIPILGQIHLPHLVT